LPCIDSLIAWAGENMAAILRERMRGKGVPKLQSSGRGDQYVHLTVEIPKHLTEKQKELLREFDAATGGTLQKTEGETQERKSFFGKKK